VNMSSKVKQSAVVGVGSLAAVETAGMNTCWPSLVLGV